MQLEPSGRGRLRRMDRLQRRAPRSRGIGRHRHCGRIRRQAQGRYSGADIRGANSQHSLRVLNSFAATATSLSRPPPLLCRRNGALHAQEESPHSDVRTGLGNVPRLCHMPYSLVYAFPLLLTRPCPQAFVHPPFLSSSNVASASNDTRLRKITARIEELIFSLFLILFLALSHSFSCYVFLPPPSVLFSIFLSAFFVVESTVNPQKGPKSGRESLENRP